MDAKRGALLLALAALLATAAAADVVITADEVLPCSVLYADTDFVRIRLPQGGVRAFNTYDVRELRLSDSARASELALRVPGLASRDTGRYFPSLGSSATRDQMRERCDELVAALRSRASTDFTVAQLLRDVRAEKESLRAVSPPLEQCAYLPCGTLLGTLIGSLLGLMFAPPRFDMSGPPQHNTFAAILTGAGAGAGLGFGLATAVASEQKDHLLSSHRRAIDSLTARYNRFALTAPGSAVDK